MIFHNSALAGLVPDDSYGAEDLARIERALGDHQTLAFVRLPSGLFAASSGGDAIASSGYGNVWVRDNIYVAYAHHVTGNTQVAAEVVRAQITNDWRCAELYYLRNNVYVANPHIPLQWTQANLLMALEGMRATVARNDES